MVLGEGARFLVRRGFAEERTVERMLHTLEYACSLGLTLVTDNVREQPSFLCNCCRCCCELSVRMVQDRNLLTVEEGLALYLWYHQSPVQPMESSNLAESRLSIGYDDPDPLFHAAQLHHTRSEVGADSFGPLIHSTLFPPASRCRDSTRAL